MGRLNLICGPAGSGKTFRMLDETARAALATPLPSPQHPPLLVIVPEQQALQIERAVFARMTELQESPAASARVRVLSLTRLAALLAERLGVKLRPLSELGRRLAAWRALGSDPLRSAEAAALAELFGEFSQYGLGADELGRRISKLAGDGAAPAGLPARLESIHAAYATYCADCDTRALDWRAPVSLLPELLERGAWPDLEHTCVWVDGFAGFTPPETRALQALLASGSELSATLLLDCQRTGGALPADFADWYRPTRELHALWLGLARQARAQVEETWLTEQHRWAADNPLQRLAQPAAIGQDGAAEFARAVVCPNERLEVDHAVEEIRRLVAAGLRYREISIVTRSLKPYAELLAARLSESGVPHFLDRRRPLAAHPVVEYFRCGLRLALHQATADDLYSLLKTEVPAAAADRAAYRDAISALEHHARRHALRLSQWFSADDWPADDSEHDAAAAERLAALNERRRELIQPLVSLMTEFETHAERGATAGELLEAAWRMLLGNETESRLLETARESAADFPGAVQLVQQALAQLRQVVSELAQFGGEQPARPRELCGWLDQAVEGLEAAAAPPTLDSVLVTEIERGRQHEIRATLLLGLSEDLWPPPLDQTPLLSDSDRELLNAGSPALVSGGTAERAGREAYLALVAATRPAEFLLLSRPAADNDGRLRLPSPFYLHFCATLGVEEQPSPKQAYAAAARDCGSLAELAACAAQDQAEDTLRTALEERGAELSSILRPAIQAIGWSRELQRREPGAGPLLPVAGLLPQRDGRPALVASASRLECFAACPFKHYARYWLRLDEETEPAFDSRNVGSFYHAVLEAAVDQLNAQGYDWIAGDAQQFRHSVHDALQRLRIGFAAESRRERALHVGDRAALLLGHRAESELELISGGLAPVLTEVRFGDRQRDLLPPVVIELDSGRLLIGGLIDRLDVGADGAARVVDYKLSTRKVDWGRFLGGEQLQLFVYLLAVDGVHLPGGSGTVLKPAGAAYLHVEPQWDKETGRFKPELLPPQYQKLNARVRELLDTALLPHALGEAQRVLRELGSRLLAGDWAPWPFSWNSGANAACSSCGFRPLCRFDPAAGSQYRPAARGGRMQFQQAIASGASFPGSASGELWDLHAEAGTGEDSDA